MKLTVLLENPDGLGDAIREAAGLPVPENVTGEERTERILSALERVAQYRQTISAWVEENGLIRLEFDLDADPPTARVLRRDGKEEIGGMLFTATEAAAVRSHAADIRAAAEALRKRYEADGTTSGREAADAAETQERWERYV